MRMRFLASRRSPLLYYGVLALLVLLLFVLGLRLGTVLTSALQTPLPVENAAASASGGAALVQPPLRVTDFTLTDQRGQPLSLSDLQGQPVLLFFGYTHCPEECPLTLLNYSRARTALGDLGSQVHFVFVSVDGERDTPAVMSEYLHNFDAEFLGLTGDEASLRAAGAQFGLLYERVVLGEDGSTRPATAVDENYFVSHISPSFLIDAEGNLVRLLFYGSTPDQIASNLREVLALS